jgi:hypothetical protein
MSATVDILAINQFSSTRQLRILPVHTPELIRNKISQIAQGNPSPHSKHQKKEIKNLQKSVSYLHRKSYTDLVTKVLIGESNHIINRMASAVGRKP